MIFMTYTVEDAFFRGFYDLSLFLAIHSRKREGFFFSSFFFSSHCHSMGCFKDFFRTLVALFFLLLLSIYLRVEFPWYNKKKWLAYLVHTRYAFFFFYCHDIYTTENVNCEHYTCTRNHFRLHWITILARLWLLTPWRFI